MERRSVEAVLERLVESGARFLVVGGVAVVAHGFVRGTKDLDLLLDLAPDYLPHALQVLADLGYQPTVPVPLDQFADPEARARWRREKDARVFPLYSDRHPTLGIDLFLENPLPFGQAWEHVAWFDLRPGLKVPFVGLDDLLAMKRAAGRPQDVVDVETLEELRRLRED